MEIRKIQMTRGGTFFVTLPKDWAIRNGITRGTIVASMVTPDGKLIIDPKYNVEPAPRTIVIKPGPHLSREIISKYLLGYDIITIEAKDRITPDQRDAIKQSSSRLIGLEIIEENYSKIVMQCLLEPSALSPEKILRREHLIASGMCRDSVTALLEGDTQLAKNVIARDNEVDRLYFLLVRVLRTIVQNPSLGEKLGMHPIDCLDYRLVASLVEAVADRSSQISEYAVKFKGLKVEDNTSKALYDLYKAVHETYNDAVTAFISHNILIAESVREKESKIKELSRRVEYLAGSLPSERAQGLTAVISLLNRIYDHSIDISDLTVPRELQTSSSTNVR
ncbi:MAG: PhoU domain-containing protein [Candidatus Bathyarchaeia archaeon]